MSDTETISPKALLSKIRNTKRGVSARSAIIRQLTTSNEQTIKQMVRELSRSRAAISRQLKNLEKENLVTRRKLKRENFWRLTGRGQKAIEET